VRVLLVNDYAGPGGGAELQVQLLREALRSRGHEVRVFASSAGAPPPGAADDLCFGTTAALRTPLQAANPSAAVRLRRVLARFRPDVVHVRMFLTQLSPLILPALRGVPSLWHVVWYGGVCPRGALLTADGRDCEHRAGTGCLREGGMSRRAWLMAMGQLALLQRTAGAFARVITISEASRRQLAARGMPVAGVLRNGVPDLPPRPPLAGPATVAFAGRLVPEKGADVLLRAFATLNGEPRLLIAGDGPERAGLQALARELGIADRVELTGRLGGSELERRLGAAWVHAMPGRWIEPFGNAGAEAMMRGTTLVATTPGGAAELIAESGAGATVPRADATALAAALAERLIDRGRCESEGARARSWALQHLRHADHVTGVERIYSELVAEAAA
jgi:glycosyltransferase involved in cell wall biosynthesis